MVVAQLLLNVGVTSNGAQEVGQEVAKGMVDGMRRYSMVVSVNSNGSSFPARTQCISRPIRTWLPILILPPHRGQILEHVLTLTDACHSGWSDMLLHACGEGIATHPSIQKG